MKTSSICAARGILGRGLRYWLATIVWLVAMPLAVGAPPGSSSAPGCGLPCEAKATIRLQVPDGDGVFSLLEGRSLYVGYTVTNQSLTPLQGVVSVTLNGQSLKDTGSQNAITLAPKASLSGMVLVSSPGSGVGLLDAKFASPLECHPANGAAEGRQPLVCSRYVLYAEDQEDLAILPDKDNDGLADTYETTVLNRYAPLMLFSKDHGSQEKYAPIDVLDFIHASSLVSKDPGIASSTNAVLKAVDGADRALDPNGNGNNDAKIGANQVDGSGASLLPRAVYLSPSSQAKTGTAWNTVLAKRNVGLYGHVSLMPASQVQDPGLAQALSQKFCDGDPNCDRSIVKIEYWQFFGYSHDFEVPAAVYAGQFFLDALFPGAIAIPTSQLAADVIDHGGDWCTVQLYIDPVAPMGEEAILAVFHYAHGLQFKFDLTQPYAAGPITGLKGVPPFDIKQFQGNNVGLPVDLPYQGGAKTQAYQNAQNNVMQLARQNANESYAHPVVYVEWGGHEFWPSPGWSLEFASKHGGNGYAYFAASPPNVGELGRPMPGVAPASAVVGFGGYWGYYGWENHNKPPQGPPLHAQWYWTPNGPVPLAARPAPNNLPF